VVDEAVMCKPVDLLFVLNDIERRTEIESIPLAELYQYDNPAHKNALKNLDIGEFLITEKGFVEGIAPSGYRLRLDMLHHIQSGKIQNGIWWMTLVGVLAGVATFFQCNRYADVTSPSKAPTEQIERIQAIPIPTTTKCCTSNSCECCPLNWAN
jgi:hypothetical protein